MRLGTRHTKMAFDVKRILAVGFLNHDIELRYGASGTTLEVFIVKYAIGFSFLGLTLMVRVRGGIR